MTLIDFLLARIADEEAAAREAIAERIRVFTRPGANDEDLATAHDPDMTLMAWPDTSVPMVVVGPERVLAECDAKRFIVAQYREVESTRGNDAMSRYSRTLEAMAAVHRDHPEFNPAWVTTHGPPPF